MKPNRFVTSLFAALVTSATYAQTSDQVEVVIVTAEKVEKSILDVTTTTNVFDADFLENEEIREMNQLSNFVPNMLVQEQSVAGPSYTIRGLGDEDGEQKLGAFFNGLNTTDRIFASQFLHDIERVEVLKGPQPTAFGSFAVIGALNVVSNTANFDGNEFMIGAGVGSFSERRLQALANVVLNDNIAMRLSAFSVDKDGYSENLNGEDQNARVGTNIRFTTSVEFDRFAADLILANEDNDGPGIGFKSKYFLPVGGSASASDPLDFGGADTSIKRDMSLYQLKTAYDLNEQISFNYNGYRNEGDLYEYFEVDGGPLRIDERDYAYESEFTGHEIFANYSNDLFTIRIGYNDLTVENEYTFYKVYGDLQHRLAYEFAQGTVIPPTGFQSFSDDTVFPDALGIQNLRQAVADTTYALNPVTVNPLTGEAVPAGVGLLVDYTAFLQPTKTETSGLFANVDVNMTDQLTLTVGVRDEETEVNGNADEASEVLWKLGANYAVSDFMSIYYNFAQGQTPSGQTVLVGTSLERESVDSHDVGVYYVAANLSLGAAYFTYDYKNLVVGIDDPVTGLPEQVNYDETSISGFEFQGEYTFNDALSAYLTYGLNDAEYGKNDDVDGIINYEGNQYRFSPEFSYAVGIRFNTEKLRSTISWNYIDDVFFEASNDPDTLQDGYGLLNASVEYDLSNQLTIGLYGKNILDKEYLIDAGNTAGSLGYPTLIEGTPANWLLTARYTF
jgi:iron complex outermembrane receptor protein